MMNRAPMQRTAWPARRPPSVKNELNCDQAFAERARHAIKNAPAIEAQKISEKAHHAQFGKARVAIKSIAPQPKPAHHRNRRLLDLARGMPCLLRIPGVCNRDPETTVAAHSNWSEHGKGAGLKAGDQFSVWACYECHRWLDAGSAPRAAKRAAFMRAHVDQVLQWRFIASDPSRPEPDRRSARWAIEQLNSATALDVCALAATD